MPPAPADPPIVPVDYCVVGAGVAGLRAAIALADRGTVALLMKGDPYQSSSEQAQGGIAAALSDDDKIAFHKQDTLDAGAGLCHERAVDVLVEEGPARVQELIEWGARFDTREGHLALAREGAHSRRRILRAGGDSTGREIVKTLGRKTASLANVTLYLHHFTTSLLLEEATGRCVGTHCLTPDHPAGVLIQARGVILTTGGVGQLYSFTTNAPYITGDGIAVAAEAGAALADMEFVQFHPTALRLRGAPPFLISEALRGEGAYLLNRHGQRFMERYDDRGELAPRDVVARAIFREIADDPEGCVYLTLAHLDGAFVAERFPRIHRTCLGYGVDIRQDLIPVRPAAHYTMGGVYTDLEGRTSLPGLYAAGEGASLGIHGANRLASNSLLDGLVFGARAARGLLADGPAPAAGPVRRTIPAQFQIGKPQSPAAGARIRSQVQRAMTRGVGIARDGDGLRRARERFTDLLTGFRGRVERRTDWETFNLLRLARLVTEAALLREESRGAHFRTDFPERDDARWLTHLLLTLHDGGIGHQTVPISD